ncbi:hypothetical protein LCGC14_2320090 [marine sediment metagenome]|uniref:Uncharacterized protein n=1 Tax=marine sediment metagenome TaxID=412755 RepID=A0A0F9EVK1_9ZZZZ
MLDRNRILDLAVQSTQSVGNDAIELAADIQEFIEDWLKHRRPKQKSSLLRRLLQWLTGY